MKCIKRKYKIEVTVFSFILIIVLIFIQLNNKRKETANLNDYINKKVYYQLYEDYNRDNNMTLKELFNEEDSLDRLVDFNLEINNNYLEQFLEIRYNPIELVGYYNNDKSLVVEGDENYINQNVVINGNNFLVTPFSAMHLDEKAFNRFNLKVLKGESFKKEDFGYNNAKVNILLGNNFINYYNIGDKIKFIFSNKTWEGNVIGFLERSQEIDLDFFLYNLDNYVIVPIMNYIDTSNIGLEDEVYGKVEKDFLQLYYFFKNNGVLYIENKEDYEKHRDKILSLSNKYNLRFDLLRGY